MKKLKLYQCSYCCYCGCEEQVREHEKLYCPVKRFDKIAGKYCFTCKHFYFRGGKHKKEEYICGKTLEMLQELPIDGACNLFELDKEWANKKKVELERSTQYKVLSIGKRPEHISKSKK